MTRPAPHATLVKFGYPAGVIADYGHWSVLLRPAQPTLGSLVIVNVSDAASFADIGAAAFAELGQVVRDCESALRSCFAYDKINYLMLMMVDPHVHFHVLPRYAEIRTFNGTIYADDFWPKAPDIGAALTMDPAEWEALRQHLRQAWPLTHSASS